MAYEHALHHLLIVTVVIVILPLIAQATDHIVGADYGWGLDGNYKVWAQGQKFYVGDTLVFKYRKGDHNVMNVSESDYETCTASPGATTLVSGDDVVELTAPGNKWYICGMPGHCSAANQKLAITVLPSSPPSAFLAPPPPNYSSFSCILMSSNFHIVIVLVTTLMLMVQ